jgi:hypothetical protein
VSDQGSRPFSLKGASVWAQLRAQLWGVTERGVSFEEVRDILAVFSTILSILKL